MFTASSIAQETEQPALHPGADELVGIRIDIPESAVGLYDELDRQAAAIAR